MFRHGTERPNAEKSEGDEPEEERLQKRKIKNKEKQWLRLEPTIKKPRKQKEAQEEETTDKKEEKKPKERKAN